MKVFRSLRNTINISANGSNIHINYLEVHELITFLFKEYPEQFKRFKND